jgi:hypothetical protein
MGVQNRKVSIHVDIGIKGHSGPEAGFLGIQKVKSYCPIYADNGIFGLTM